MWTIRHILTRQNALQPLWNVQNISLQRREHFSVSLASSATEAKGTIPHRTATAASRLPVCCPKFWRRSHINNWNPISKSKEHTTRINMVSGRGDHVLIFCLGQLMTGWLPRIASCQPPLFSLIYRKHSTMFNMTNYYLNCRNLEWVAWYWNGSIATCAIEHRKLLLETTVLLLSTAPRVYLKAVFLAPFYLTSMFQTYTILQNKTTAPSVRLQTTWHSITPISRQFKPRNLSLLLWAH